MDTEITRVGGRFVFIDQVSIMIQIYLNIFVFKRKRLWGIMGGGEASIGHIIPNTNLSLYPQTS